MSHATPRACHLHLHLLAAAAALAIAAGPLQAQQLIAPNAPVAGFSQSYLAAQFAQWASYYPTGANPTRDDTGAFSALGDQGSYFFLGASDGSGPVVRSVTVRSDQTLFVSLLSVLDYVGGSVQTEAAMREELGWVLGPVSNLSLTVNGVDATLPAGFGSLAQFRQDSPMFPITFVENNIYGIPPGVLPAISGGYFAAMQPLPVGNYTLHLTAHVDMTGPFTGGSLSQDITYNISSVPEPSTWAAMALGLVAISATTLRRRRSEER